jgi:hypothetical protein
MGRVKYSGVTTRVVFGAEGAGRRSETSGNTSLSLSYTAHSPCSFAFQFTHRCVRGCSLSLGASGVRKIAEGTTMWERSRSPHRHEPSYPHMPAQFFGLAVSHLSSSDPPVCPCHVLPSCPPASHPCLQRAGRGSARGKSPGRGQAVRKSPRLVAVPKGPGAASSEHARRVERAGGTVEASPPLGSCDGARSTALLLVIVQVCRPHHDVVVHDVHSVGIYHIRDKDSSITRFGFLSENSSVMGAGSCTET